MAIAASWLHVLIWNAFVIRDPQTINAYAANQFSAALSSGQMGPVMNQFGLPPEVTSAASTGDMQAFFKALENTSNASDSSKSQEEDKKKEKAKEEKDGKKDDDAGMSLD
ncbi:Proteasomal ubiquitin receptor ADRM1 [Papilio machaon]|uniref:Proteasomal ubiquitin receptor ADRM1 n=1 Tax=Papilio machaon TaxID=76193 RepID=A0A0N1IQH4_PAPMA|nr:Proteasomal ubiquitin receptor ADRM1 [Papilio machaon]